MHILSTEGVNVEYHGEIINLKGSLSFVSCDNLGAHWIGGFQESFRAVRFCRHCMITSDKCNTVFNESQVALRSKNGYNNHVQLVQENPTLSSVYGVKHESPLNAIEGFHVVDGLPPDIAHDLFEGVIHYALDDICKECVNRGYFTLEQLNSIIQEFPYEGSDKVNKPQTMNETIASFSVKQTAAQSWCMLRLMPLFVGKFVPKGCEIWEVLLSLLDVVELACSPVQTTISADYLGVLIQTFLCGYCECFPENKGLKPKFHFLIHYPTLIKKFGPLIYLWTLRFEAKHSYFKGLINQIKCWKNITYTLAKRHQYLQCYHNTARHNFLQSEKMNETGGKPKDFNKLGEDLQRELRPLLHDQPNVHSASSICLNGINYCKGLFVVLKVDGHIITFGKIMKIYIISGVSWLWCSLCELRGYDRHKHSCKVYVCTEAQKQLHSPTDIPSYYPLPGYQVDGATYITLKHRLKGEDIF